MNINLVYKGKDYNFDIPNGVTIDYLKELSSKIFNSEKDFLDLIYNNEKIENNNDSTLIKDFIPRGETNAVITVQINKKSEINKLKNNKKFSLINLTQKNKQTITKEDNKTRINKEENSEYQKLEKKPIKIFEPLSRKELSTLKENKTKNSYIKDKLNFNNHNINFIGKDNEKKKAFENNYNNKNNEFLSVIKEFNEKIKKVYLILYNKYINSRLMNNKSNIILPYNSKSTLIMENNTNNNNSFYELSLYEKKIINFIEKQIQYYKKLLETIQKFDNNINFTQLNEFYKKLIFFKFDENININNDQTKHLKFTSILNKKTFQSNSSLNISTINTFNSKLPILKNTNTSKIKDKNINILKFNLNKNNSSNDINSRQNDFKKAKIKRCKTINSYIRKTESKNNILLHNEEKHLSSTNNLYNINDNLFENDPIKRSKTNNLIFNNISPIFFHKKEFFNNSLKNSPERYANINNGEDKIIKNTSTINLSKFKNSPEIKNYLDEMKKNIDIDIKKIKDIDVSSMTINDSNFNREKIITYKKKRYSKNKFDFII